MNRIRISFQSILNSSSFRNTFILASGSTIAQVISFVFLIILQRWFYAPADFGLLGLYVSLSTLLVACSTLKFEYAILIPRDDQDAIGLVKLSVFSVAIITLLTALVFPLLKGVLPSIPETHFKTFGILITVNVLISGIFEVMVYWNNRNSDYKNISISRIIQNSSTEISRLIMGLGSMGGVGLIFGRVLGQAISALYLGRNFFKINSNYKLISQIDLTEFRKIFYTYRNFPLFTVPTVFISNFSNLVLIALFFEYYGDSNAGLVSISIQYIALPFGIISSSFSQVFYKKITSIESKIELMAVYLRFSKNLFVISGIIVFVVYLIPESFIVYLIGPEWSELVAFMKLSVLWQGIAFISSSLSFIYTRLMKQRAMIIFAIIQLAIVYITLVFGNTYFNDAFKTFLVYVVGQSFYYILSLVAAIYFIKNSKIVK